MIRPEQAHKMRQSGMKYAAIADRMRCSISTVHRYIDRWEQHLEVLQKVRIRMQWFGASWGAPFNRECDHVETPVGADCLVCGREIHSGDQGFLIPRLDACDDVSEVLDAAHLECFLYAIGVRK